MPKKSPSNQLELWSSDAYSTATQETLFTSDQLDRLSPRNPRSKKTERTPTPTSTSRLLDHSFAQRRPLNILVADDNEINRKVIRIILQKLGYSCVEAENGREALERHSEDNYDYIFMDIDMPEMDGIEATHAIRSAERDEPQAEIIAVTANVSNETRLKCRRAGMNGYLEKPITATIIKDQLLRSWPRIRSRRGKKS
ncbi:response regulator [Pelagicoccus sp. SDUM812003]|uniref:response regulator n=1 Tax=Pelagicoccus sp. SDUM812003 TaxID=3041267 RepID=UPI00280ED955|nr:response regulator [Pelagicoccus sp. SDUM812003]MDQ8202722.1 response regulator [Pelagicoccus sp. SDUM812003]